ncbi:multidrug-efflux transporter, MFS family [Deferribacter desulfuricans SSM1]|uniref:Multidrug-efflux transporter, MFS family n=1 Tax=Deferribacter desulfuricans (strain DSM 14783 / JCM 11476 / NBRC 101012 / SSM1) TaxID=639282 RepID=D3P8P4_DEFDS|nr:MFS transporter [Deferribacter desulfuricans]BAI81084.1 multidrug-efflux transporter, MFS family [Deferribacter desulfuricans SSM1]
MSKKYLFIIAFSTIMVFSALYAPQPLLPVIAKDFNVTKDAASLLITVTLIPLALAPLFYGYILEKFSAKVVISLSFTILALSEVVVYFTHNFTLFLLIRLLNGLVLPAILTGLMTYISISTSKENVQRVMAFYIASTIVGGFSGRLVSGFISTYFGWRYVFLFLFFTLLISLLLILQLEKDDRLNVSKLKLDMAKNILKKKEFLFCYLTIFFTFFVFAGFLNILPFRMFTVSSKVTEFKTGIMYSGYMLGVLISLNNVKILKKLNNSAKLLVIIGLTIYLVSLFVMSFNSVVLLFLGMFLFCGGMFTVHSTLSGYLNRLAMENKGVVNGLYVSFYYTGGSIGSYLAVYIYRHFGWFVVLFFLAAMILFANLFVKQCS